MNRIRISATTFGLLRECPRCFWYEVRGVSRPRGMFSSLPSALDKIIQQETGAYAVKGQKPVWLRGGCELLTVRKKLESVYKGIEIVGIVDDLVRDERGGYTIVDYKTSGYQYTREKAEHYYTAQMSIYAWLCEEKGYEPVNGAVLVFFTPSFHSVMEHEASEVQFVFDVTVIPVAVNRKYAEDLLGMAVELIHLREPPDRALFCKWCDWLERRRRS